MRANIVPGMLLAAVALAGSPSSAVADPAPTSAPSAPASTEQAVAPRIPQATSIKQRWTSFKRWLADDEQTLSAEASMPVGENPSSTEAIASASAQEVVEPTTSDIPMSPGEIAGTVDSTPVVDETASPLLAAAPAEPVGWGWYGRLDFIYWSATDPKPKGSAFNQFSGGVDQVITPTSVITERIRIDDPNTDYEMGFRKWIGAHASDRLALEWGILWANPTSYLEQLFSRPAQSNGFNTTPADTVRIGGTNEPVDFANMSWRSRFWGTELNGRYHLMEGPIWYFDAVGGMRYFSYDERLVFEYDRDVRSTVALTRRERFNTDNDLLGAQLGGDLQLRLFEYVTWANMGRVGLMGNMQHLDVTGPTPGEGRFTNASNLGSRSASDFSPLFEFTSSIALELTPAITFQLGYTAIWIGNVLRATDQVDLLNVGGSPIASMATDDIWIQGFTSSITYKW